MFANFQTNFYIRKDADNLLWSGLSLNFPEEEYCSYKLSSYITKQPNKSWRGEQSELIVFDKDNNMYTITRFLLSQLYNPDAQDKKVPFAANLARAEDKYLNTESANIYLNEKLIKDIVDQLKTKAEQSFGVKISI